MVGLVIPDAEPLMHRSSTTLSTHIFGRRVALALSRGGTDAKATAMRIEQ
jgi:hypothetical protein